MDRQASTSRNYLESMLLDDPVTTDLEPMPLPLSLLDDITSGFSEDQQIGRGGFAVVYKGTLSGGLTVAVKRLSHSYMHEKEFHREVECLLKVKHTNVVRFLGYCADTQGSMGDFDGQVVMADVQQRLLCFEYLQGSLDEHIQDPSTGLEWSKRYNIIHGICEGLSYLHRKNIIHLDLKPNNILLDSNMVPKISDFGLSRIFEEDKSRFTATKVGGTIGYLAPEFASHVITHKFDLYSLGVILIEMLTGKKGYQDVETVLENWSNRLDKSQGDTRFEQIRVCAEIAIACIDPNPEKRPVSIHHIVTQLNETGSTQVNPISSELLDVKPLVLRFRFEPNKSIQCPLQLTNNTGHHVSFGLMNKSSNQNCFARLPLYGVVPPKSVYSLVVTTGKQQKIPEQKYFDLMIESSILGDEHISSPIRYNNDIFFEKAKKLGHVVHSATLKAVCTLHQGVLTPKVFNTYPIEDCDSSDTHPTKQWIILGLYSGHIQIWSYETQRLVVSYKLPKENLERGCPSRKVASVKFIERKKWFAAGTEGGFIHVYNYDKMRKITSFRANTDSKSVISLVVHPTQPYLLSVSANCEAKLWDWNKGWECTHTFMTELSLPSSLQLVVFNPMDINIACASINHTIKILGPGLPESECKLSGHSKKVNCLEFFTQNDQQYLITGSNDCTAKIWDMQKKTCVHTEAFMSQVYSVSASPNLPILITGLRDGQVHLWSSANFRVEKVLQIGFSGAVCRLAFLTGPHRVLIRCEDTISVMHIDNVSSDFGSEGSCGEQLSTDSLQGDTISKVTLDSSNPLDVLIPPFPTECSLQLTNNTDERVAFRINGKGGIVPAKSSYTLIVNHRAGNILESAISGDTYMCFEDEKDCNRFFKDAERIGNVVHKLTLEANLLPRGETTSTATIPPIRKIILAAMENYKICCLDAHPTEPLILAGFTYGRTLSGVSVWKFDALDEEIFAQLPMEPASVKFIAQKKWLVAGTLDGFIHVFKYGTNVQKITSFKATDNKGIRLAVHPTQSYVMSLSDAGLIKLWEWHKGWRDFIRENRAWKCTQRFEDEQSRLVWPIAFNPKDTNCFVVASNDNTIKGWNIDSPRSNYTLSGHSGKVNCLGFFTRDNRNYLISGSDDCTTKIWDMTRKTCVHTLRAFMSPVLSVLSLPDLPYLIFVSGDGIIHMWNSRNSRLERMVSFGCSDRTPCLYLMGTRRLVIEHWWSISFMELDSEESSAVTSLNSV